MNRDPGDVLPLSSELIELALAQVEHSAEFRSSPRHRALLRHLVSRALSGDHAALKETVIAVEIFGRPVASFNPRVDSIVRVEARRLRARLSNYYRTDGRDSAIRIELPVGSYVPLIAARERDRERETATRRARDLVERGEHFLRQPLGKESLEQALERFDLALRESPECVAAFVGMGRAWLNLATGWYVAPAVASEHAAEALRCALALDPDDSVAHALLGAIQHQFEHDWAAAQRSFRRAVALAPRMAFVHSAYGCHLYMRGDFDESERELRLARSIDPMYINARSHMVNLRIAQRRFEDALAELDALTDLAPAAIGTAGLRGAIAMYRGDTETAIARYEQACRDMPDYPGCFVALASALAKAGHFERADGLVAETLERCGAHSVSPYLLAIFEVRRGHSDAAFEHLERAVAERDPYAVQIPREPSFESLSADPRWAPILTSFGLGKRVR